MGQRRPGVLAAKGASMQKWVCWGSLGVGVVLLLLFLTDMVMYIAGVSFLPFEGLSPYFVDPVCIIASGVLIYLAYDTLRDIR